MFLCCFGRYRLFGDCVNTAARMVRYGRKFGGVSRAHLLCMYIGIEMQTRDQQARISVHGPRPRPSLTSPLHSVQETSAPPGEIQLSQATADLLRAPPPGAPNFELMERGPMKIKGKGEMVRGHFPKENGAMLRFPCPSF